MFRFRRKKSIALLLTSVFLVCDGAARVCRSGTGAGNSCTR
ncbi:MAG: hypothetical protein RJR35_03985 [Thermoanaerobacterales bacterium]|nr:hypothetical protein [Thermoanaerobacterales bacterium]